MLSRHPQGQRGLRPQRPITAAADAQRLQQALDSHRRARSLALGPCMWLRFEDELTGSTTPEHRFRLNGTHWLATLQIGLPDRGAAGCNLGELQAAVGQLYVQLPRMPRVMAEPLGEASAPVQHLRFAFTPPLRVALLAGAPASVGCAHDRYAHRRVIPLAMLEQLRCDLARL